MKDWNGSKASGIVMIGARNYAKEEREKNDFYATPPKAVEQLLELETFDNNIWECACGKCHIANTLEEHGYNVYKTDLIDRGCQDELIDFLNSYKNWNGDIITNPPYKYAKEFVRKSMESINDGHKVAMFLKLQFLESKGRRKLFINYPPKTIYVSTGRCICAMNGEFEKYKKSNAVTYAWFIWEKGFKGDPIIKWFNDK